MTVGHPRRDPHPALSQGCVELNTRAAAQRPPSRNILGVRVDVTSYTDATQRIIAWAREGSSRYVCACNVHMVMEAHDDPEFRAIVNRADLVAPDGMPLVWTLRLLGASCSRVYGPDLMLALCAAAEREGVTVGLYGSTEAVSTRLSQVLQGCFPALRIGYAYAPPLGEAELGADQIREMERNDIRILFVALGCPKQERWMARHAGSVQSVMLGVGAAFDFVAGAKPRAPRLLQRAGLEWAFRLSSEPRRLMRRYAVHNPRFVALVIRQLLGRRRRHPPA